MLVELACSVTLIPAYYPELFDKLVPAHDDGSKRNVIFIVCGGFLVSLDSLTKYQQVVEAELSPTTTRDLWCNGELWKIQAS